MAAPKGNTNAERWTREEAEKFFSKALDLSKKNDYDFIGEVAYDLDEDKGVFDYLIEKFPDLSYLKSRIKANCEVNCFRNMKKEKINVATGMINLKSNHGWTDRVASDHTTNGQSMDIAPITWVKSKDDTTQ